MKRILAAVVALIFVALPASAHTTSELEAWYADWLAAPALSSELSMALMDMKGRHPCFPQACPEPSSQTVAHLDPVTVTQPIYTTGVEQWRPLVVAYWPVELVEWALRIMACESGGNPSANNPTSSAAGLFQFLRSTWDNGPAPALGLGSYNSGAVYNPELNVMAAAWLYANWGGASQWSCKA